MTEALMYVAIGAGIGLVMTLTIFGFGVIVGGMAVMQSAVVEPPHHTKGDP